MNQSKKIDFEAFNTTVKHNANWVMSFFLIIMGILNLIYAPLNTLYFLYTMSNVGWSLMIYCILQDMLVVACVLMLIFVHPKYPLYDVTMYDNVIDIGRIVGAIIPATFMQNLLAFADITQHGLSQDLVDGSDALFDYYFTMATTGVLSGLMAWEIPRYITVFTRRSHDEVLVTDPMTSADIAGDPL